MRGIVQPFDSIGINISMPCLITSVIFCFACLDCTTAATRYDALKIRIGLCGILNRIGNRVVILANSTGIILRYRYARAACRRIRLPGICRSISIHIRK